MNQRRNGWGEVRRLMLGILSLFCGLVLFSGCGNDGSHTSSGGGGSSAPSYSLVGTWTLTSREVGTTNGYSKVMEFRSDGTYTSTEITDHWQHPASGTWSVKKDSLLGDLLRLYDSLYGITYTYGYSFSDDNTLILDNGTRYVFSRS
jgi:hypothetical protein